MKNLLLIAGFLAGLAPAPQISVSEWSCKNIVLSNSDSSRPGNYDIRVTPYWEEVMDNLGAYSTVQETIVQKSNQVGFTQLLNCWTCYTIDADPAPILNVLATEELAKRNSTLRLGPMIDNTPVLSKKVGKARERDSGNNTLRKTFPSGYWVGCGANSPNDARMLNFKKVGMDELSAYPMDMGGEGDPYKLFYGRTKTYEDRKILAGSTPTTEGNCRISSLYRDTDQRKYHVVCPHCQKLQHLEFGRLHWDKDVYKDVWYECLSGCRIDERYKTRMMSKEAGAKWIPTRPEKSTPLKRGYHINAMYAPLGLGFSWAKLAAEYDEADRAEDRELAMKTFTNLQLGETWSNGGDVPEYESLIERAVDYPDGSPVNEVVRLTAGVDIQKNRIEVEVLGWASGKANYSVAYEVLEGSTDEPDVWDKLRAYLESDFIRPDKGIMNISYTCIDSQYLATDVYEFCESFGAQRCTAIKGSDTQPIVAGTARPIKYNKRNRRQGNATFRFLGVSVIKQLIYSKLKLKIDYAEGVVPVGYCYFPKNRGVYYFKGLCSEVHKKVNGKLQWVKIVERNEPLDLRVYAYAAGYIQGYNRMPDEWYHEQSTMFNPERKQFTARPVRERRTSSHWNR